MKKQILYILFVATSFTFAQTKEMIKNSDSYYWGEAVSNNESEASRKALGNLTGMIAVRVKENYKRKIEESNLNLDETVTNILETFSTATLQNVQTLKQPLADLIEVFHYIPKTEVKKIFDERRKMIRQIYESALQFEEDHNFGYALKHYFFTVILMNSLPDQNFQCDENNLVLEVPSRINRIINESSFYLKDDRRVSENERELVFDVEVDDKLAEYLEFSFWDGTSQVNVIVKDGEGRFKLYGSSVDFLDLKFYIKYNFYECKGENKEVNDLWDLVLRPTFKNGIDVKLVIEEPEIIISEIQSTPEPGNDTGLQLNLNYGDDCPVKQQINIETQKLISVFTQDNPAVAATTYSADLFLKDKIIDIMNYNRISVSENLIDAKINKTCTGWELRKVKVLNYYPSINTQATEYMILDFTEEGKLYDITFGITEGLYNDFVEQSIYGEDWGNRQVIIKFMERYRTAFLSRSSETLDSLFSDEAVIIVGRVIRKGKMSDAYKYSQIDKTQPTYEQIRLTKDEYLQRQKRVFNSQKDLFLGFSKFKISRKNNQKNVYGISLRQDYRSTTYSDEGYLFLLVDFYSELPQIYVRSWQPQEWDEAALIGLSNFNINR